MFLHKSWYELLDNIPFWVHVFVFSVPMGIHTIFHFDFEID